MARLLIYTAFNLTGFRNGPLSSAFTSAIIKYNVRVKKNNYLNLRNFLNLNNG